MNIIGLGIERLRLKLRIMSDDGGYAAHRAPYWMELATEEVRW
jgi:hypothetical protein